MPRRDHSPYWPHSSPEPGDTPQRECARGEWCAGREVTFEDGQRVVTPARSPRAYCDKCSAWLAECAEALPPFYARLAAMIGDPLQAEVAVRIPFGPQIPLREDIDAHMRLMAVILGGWEARVRATARLNRLDIEQRPGSQEAIRQSAETIATHIGVTLALQPQWMTRSFRTPLDEETAAWLADTEIVRVGIDYIEVLTLVDGEDAGRDIQYLHYRARSLLLETNPPPEILIVPCRRCTHRTLRRAYPDGDRDLYSRCDSCHDEMTAGEYDVNSRRWVAYHRAHQGTVPVLGDAPQDTSVA